VSLFYAQQEDINYILQNPEEIEEIDFGQLSNSASDEQLILLMNSINKYVNLKTLHTYQHFSQEFINKLSMLRKIEKIVGGFPKTHWNGEKEISLDWSPLQNLNNIAEIEVTVGDSPTAFPEFIYSVQSLRDLTIETCVSYTNWYKSCARKQTHLDNRLNNWVNLEHLYVNGFTALNPDVLHLPKLKSLYLVGAYLSMNKKFLTEIETSKIEGLSLWDLSLNQENQARKLITKLNQPHLFEISLLDDTIVNPYAQEYDPHNSYSGNYFFQQLGKMKNLTGLEISGSISSELDPSNFSKFKNLQSIGIEMSLFDENYEPIESNSEETYWKSVFTILMQNNKNLWDVSLPILGDLSEKISLLSDVKEELVDVLSDITDAEDEYEEKTLIIEDATIKNVNKLKSYDLYDSANLSLGADKFVNNLTQLSGNELLLFWDEGWCIVQNNNLNQLDIHAYSDKQIKKFKKIKDDGGFQVITNKEEYLEEISGMIGIKEKNTVLEEEKNRLLNDLKLKKERIEKRIETFSFFDE
jgi:hypothetical protein